MGAIASVLMFALWLFIIVIFVRIAFSFVSPFPTNPVSRFAWMITEPVLAPVRRRLPPVSGWDLSPLVVTVVCYFLIDALGFIG
jgi:YggT family protein